jgi:tetratricopeptide (TPR) repeat protein
MHSISKSNSYIGSNGYCVISAFSIVVTIFLLPIFTACFSSGGEEYSVLRGDEAAARGDMDAALAEYSLAVRQGSEDASTLARVAHTYVEVGRIDEAGEFYHKAVEQDDYYTDQAVSDMIFLARAAQDRDDFFGLASAMETAMSFRAGIIIRGMVLPLARHYFGAGEYATALPYYQYAISGMGEDTIPEVLFEAASAYDEVDDCRRALLYYEQYRRMISRWHRGEVDWKIGSCSLRIAQELRMSNKDEEALLHIERTIAMGEPRSLQAVAYFEMGESLSDLGRCEDAMDAFLQVQRVDQTGSSPLVKRAQWRYDELRFVGPSSARLGMAC